VGAWYTFLDVVLIWNGKNLGFGGSCRNKAARQIFKDSLTYPTIPHNYKLNIHCYIHSEIEKSKYSQEKSHLDKD